MSRTFRILDRHDVFQGFLRIEELTLQYERFDGSMTGPLTRQVMHRRDAVAILLCDRKTRDVFLCEQFRAPTVDQGNGWLLELPAGMIDPGESEAAAARRESLEEAGYQVMDLHRIACIYPSPGNSSERIHIFYSEVSEDHKPGPGGGKQDEGEDIRLVRVPVTEAIAMARNGQIHDARTLIALQWLALEDRG